MGQTPPKDAPRDPAAAIVAVAVPGYRKLSEHYRSGFGVGPEAGMIDLPARDIVFVLTELGHVYRIVDGGAPALVFSPVPLSNEGRQDP